MSEITHDVLAEHLSGIKGEFPHPICLVYGDDFLCNQALETVLKAILPEVARGRSGVDIERLDGASASLADALDRVRTYSLIPEPKAVVLSGARVFYTKTQLTPVFEKAKSACENQDMEKCAAGIMNLLSLSGLPLEKALEDVNGFLSGISAADSTDANWMKNGLLFCREQGMEATAPADDARILKTALERGFPPKNRLVITTDVVLRKHALFKLFLEAGLVVNCAVAKGESSYDKKEQEKVARAQITRVLSELGKTLAPDAFALLWNRVGFDLYTMSQGLKTVAAYVGDKKRIAADDVRAVLVKTKQDPIFEFTNAFAGREAEKALETMNELLAHQFHPLQLLSAMAGQFRRLLVARNFLQSPDGGAFSPAMPFKIFQNQMGPLVKASDLRFEEKLAEWEEAFKKKRAPSGSANHKKKSKTKKPASDLILAKNPKSLYPVFMLLKNASRFTTSELVNGILALKQAETRLKSGDRNPRILLENIIFSIAGNRKRH